MILLVMVVYLLFQRYNLGSWEGWLPFGISFGSTILAFLVALNAILHLPLVDFLPYKLGNNIPQQMKPLAELKYGKEQYVYTNLKTGKDEVLNTDEFTKNWQKYSDSTQYKFKSYEKPLLNPEALAKITDYRVEDANGADLTQESFKGDKLLIIVPEVKTTYPDAFKKISELAKTLEKQKIKTWILTGEAEKSFENFRHYYQIALPYFLTDKKVLKTMIRANPGIIWLQNGTVKGKWHYNDTPQAEAFK
jgi:hypothetical protein